MSVVTTQDQVNLNSFRNQFPIFLENSKRLKEAQENPAYITENAATIANLIEQTSEANHLVLKFMEAEENTGKVTFSGRLWNTQRDLADVNTEIGQNLWADGRMIEVLQQNPITEQALVNAGIIQAPIAPQEEAIAPILHRSYRGIALGVTLVALAAIGGGLYYSVPAVRAAVDTAVGGFSEQVQSTANKFASQIHDYFYPVDPSVNPFVRSCLANVNPSSQCQSLDPSLQYAIPAVKSVWLQNAVASAQKYAGIALNNLSAFGKAHITFVQEHPLLSVGTAAATALVTVAKHAYNTHTRLIDAEIL